METALIDDGSDAIYIPHGYFEKGMSLTVAIGPFVDSGRMFGLGKEIGHFLSSAHDYYD